MLRDTPASAASRSMLSFLLLRMRLMFSPTARVSSMAFRPLTAQKARILSVSFYIVRNLSFFVKRKAGRPTPSRRTSLEKCLQAMPNRDIIDMKNKNAAAYGCYQHPQAYAGGDAPTQRPSGRTA